MLGIIAAVTVFFCLRHRRKLNRPAYTPAMTQQHGFLGAPEQQTYSQATPYSLSSSGPVTPNLYGTSAGPRVAGLHTDALR